jgi:hypothetical protein
MDSPRDAKATVEAAIEEVCFPCSSFRDVLSRTVGATELVVGLSPTGKNVSMEAEGIVMNRR